MRLDGGGAVLSEIDDEHVTGVVAEGGRFRSARVPHPPRRADAQCRVAVTQDDEGGASVLDRPIDDVEIEHGVLPVVAHDLPNLAVADDDAVGAVGVEGLETVVERRRVRMARPERRSDELDATDRDGLVEEDGEVVGPLLRVQLRRPDRIGVVAVVVPRQCEDGDADLADRLHRADQVVVVDRIAVEEVAADDDRLRPGVTHEIGDRRDGVDAGLVEPGLRIPEPAKRHPNLEISGRDEPHCRAPARWTTAQKCS